MSYGLVPIVEPEVSIDAKDKEQCEKILKEEIKKELDKLPADSKLMFKFTIPSVADFYSDIIDNPKVVRVVALSGGYTSLDACNKLSLNHGMIASFSRALLEGLNVNDSDLEFDNKLKEKIDMIYSSSIT